MQFDNTEPALVERQVGDGSVILFASAMDLEWNNLPLQSLFLPFVRKLFVIWFSRTETKSIQRWR